ncbi:IMV MP/virus entry (Cop-A28L) [Adoxophyes honmai entomopoxvirus 'L']|uniref:IMV MP/virus entry (Cop-A28L) n=1 Tax=Adoxophyes honmai entomopoxvirus 'L' TaxID=1293540 RepID=A0A916KP38_9POXV|nr:IMV MP/virus entry (Cop-A28L) [Adoxophyes honmai entomopoxvirus 'L']CCU55473.1 IMV MP/virus entry (Cop-A28L) [Adoxophyes honmai entomopoxvirus 'L']
MIRYFIFNNSFFIHKRMNIIQVIVIILITASLCFLIFQLWYYAENYEYVLRYNDSYSNLQYAKSTNINFDDLTVYDPNDNIFNVEEKWRCASSNNIFYAVSKFGFLSTESTGIHLTYNNYRDCILDLFSRIIKIIYNPCVVETSSDCVLLKLLISNTT